MLELVGMMTKGVPLCVCVEMLSASVIALLFFANFAVSSTERKKDLRENGMVPSNR